MFFHFSQSILPWFALIIHFYLNNDAQCLGVHDEFPRVGLLIKFHYALHGGLGEEGKRRGPPPGQVLGFHGEGAHNHDAGGGMFGVFEP